MRYKKSYQCPRVLKAVSVVMEADLLTGSISNSVSVETAGQQVDGFYDAAESGSTFNFKWED